MSTQMKANRGTVRINFEVDLDLREQFRRFAASKNMSMSELLRDFVCQVLQPVASTEDLSPLVTTWNGTRPHALHGTQWRTPASDAPLPWWLHSNPAVSPSASSDAESSWPEPW